MNKFGLLLGALLLASTAPMYAQMDASIKLNEVMTDNGTSLQDEYGQRYVYYHGSFRIRPQHECA